MTPSFDSFVLSIKGILLRRQNLPFCQVDKEWREKERERERERGEKSLSKAWENKSQMVLN